MYYICRVAPLHWVGGSFGCCNNRSIDFGVEVLDLLDMATTTYL